MINILSVIWAIKMNLRCGKCLPKNVMQQLYYSIVWMWVWFLFRFSFSSPLSNLLNFFSALLCLLIFCRYGIFLMVYRKHIAHSCIMYHHILRLLVCLHASLPFEVSYVYIKLSENIPLSSCIHCTWIS